jgi:hypothetical protein
MKYSKIILFTLVAVVLTDSFKYISFVGALNVENATLISAVLNYLSIGLLSFIAYKEGFAKGDVPKRIQNLIKIWLFWNIFNLIKGSLTAVDYWDWKVLLLSGVSFSFIPLTFFLGKNISIARLIFKYIITYLFVFGFLFIPLSFSTNQELYSRLMIPISLFILFIPYLKYKWRLLVIIVAVISIAMVIEFRSNLIKIAFSVFVLLIYYFRNIIRVSWIRLAHLSLFAIPIIFFTLAVTNRYNIFKEISKDEGYTTTNNLGEEENLTSDTRTFLYVEVFNTINNSGSWFFGSGAAGSYQSDWFYNDGGAINGKRYGCEVGMLNILLRYGLVGVIIYFLILFIVSFQAIKNSSNILSKMLGLFVAFRWTYSFVEEYTQYDLNFYFFWIVVGLISSLQFRRMNDLEVRNYFKLG